MDLFSKLDLETKTEAYHKQRREILQKQIDAQRQLDELNKTLQETKKEFDSIPKPIGSIPLIDDDVEPGRAEGQPARPWNKAGWMSTEWRSSEQRPAPALAPAVRARDKIAESPSNPRRASGSPSVVKKTPRWITENGTVIPYVPQHLKAEPKPRRRPYRADPIGPGPCPDCGADTYIIKKEWQTNPKHTPWEYYGCVNFRKTGCSGSRQFPGQHS